MIDPETGLPRRAVAVRAGPASSPTRSCGSADERPDVVGDHRGDAAARRARTVRRASSPTRVFDVGIAEQHAATSAAGMAFGGLHPVVAVYATFLNRAFDQVLMDVALHKAGVTFVLDRAGVTGADGASHNGMWDMAMLAGRARPAPRRARATSDTPARGAARGGRRRRRPDRGPLPQGRAGRTRSRRSTTLDGVDVLPGTRVRPTRRTCSSSGRRDGADRARDGRAARRARAARHGRRPALGHAGLRGADQAGRGPRPRRHHRGRRRRRRPRVAGGAAGREAGIGTPVQAVGIPRAFLDHATREQLVTELRLRPRGHRAGHAGRPGPSRA